MRTRLFSYNIITSPKFGLQRKGLLNMSNENKNIRNEGEERRDRLKYLLDNRMGVLPDSVSVTITNRMIEKTITGYLRANKIDVDDNIAVCCQWNDRFTRCIDTGKMNGEPPFFISVLVRTPKANRGTVQNNKYNRLLGKLSQENESKYCQLTLMNKPELNKVLSTLAEQVNGDKVGWRSIKGRGKKERKQMRNIMECPLSVDAVMKYCFSTDNSRGNAIVFDFTSVKADKKGNFTLRVIKKYHNKSFKQVSGDLLSNINRNRLRH